MSTSLREEGEWRGFLLCLQSHFKTQVTILPPLGKFSSSFQTCFACVHMYILYACVYICVCVYVCGHVFIYICACVYVYLYVCVYTHVYVYVYAYLCIDWESQYQCLACGRCNGCACVTMYICMRMHMGVGIYICAFFCSECYMHFGKVFWTLVHEQVCTLDRCVFTPTYTSANTLAAGCAHVCICIYVCVCVHIHMDACVRLWYCLTVTRWGVVARIFYLFIRVHMHAYVYVCACMCV